MLSKIVLFTCLIYSNDHFPFTIMLNPAGDNQHAGRKLHDQYERGTAFQFAKNLEHELITLDPQIQVVLSHGPSQTLEPLQTANLANHLNVDLFITLHFYDEQALKSQIAIYYFQNQSYFYAPNGPELHFYPYTKAYLTNFNLTKRLAEQLQAKLQAAKYQESFRTQRALGLPFKPLVGIVPPSLGLELGLKSADSSIFIKPVAASLIEVLHAR
jgi:N-acetylmuramoyl-L-alanine amidase